MDLVFNKRLIRNAVLLIGLMCLFGYIIFGFYKFFEESYKEKGILKSRFSYLLNEDVLSLLKNEYAFENKRGSRIVSLNSADTCRFFIFDFPIFKKSDFSKMTYQTGAVESVDLDAYYFLESPEGYEYSVNTSTDTISFKKVIINEGKVKSVEKHEEYILMSLNFDKLSLVDESDESHLLIESPHKSINCNIIVGEFDEKLVFCLFVNERRSSLSLANFKSYLML